MILLDTCVLLWLATDQKKLSSLAKNIIRDNAGSLNISAISSFEIALKYHRKKLLLPVTPAEWISTVLEHHGIREIPVNSKIATASAGLPFHHNDPADRMIIATAMTLGMTIVTPDPLIARYAGVTARW